MDYQEFKSRLLGLVRERLAEEGEASFVRRRKNNRTEKEGICIQRPDGTQQTVIYIEELYHDRLQDAELEGMAEKLVCIFRNAADIPGAEELKDWESVKERVRIRLVRKDWNQEELKDRVYREYLDFAVTLAVELGMKEGRSGSVPVGKDLPEIWGVGEDEIYRRAWENLYRERYYVVPIERLLPEGYPVSETKMYVLMRENRTYGAGLLLREDILRRFAEEQGGNIYILPSSVHELVLIRQEEEMEVSELRGVVELVNEDLDVMKPEEKLSDNVYLYDRESREIRIAR